MSVIVESLTKRYGDRAVVRSLDLQVAQGELFALLGPNGAGKTTALEMIEGYRAPDEGTVRVLGLDPRREARQLRPRMGVMLQEGGLYPQMRVGEVLGLFATYYSQAVDPDELLEGLGLERLRSRKVRTLSGGEKQRLNLATALVGRPMVLFLDEPTSGMDPEMRQATWDRLISMKSEGVMVMFTTHLTEEAERYADRVAVIIGGELKTYGTPSELTQGMPLTFTTDRILDLDELRRASSLQITEISPRRYRTHEEHSADLMNRVHQAVSAQGASLVESKRGSLEDVMRAHS